MPYGKLESTFHNDPKFYQLSEALGLPRELGVERGAALARGFVASIWSWAYDNSPDGHLPDSCRSTDLERIAGWPSAKGRLYSALVAVGFVDESTTEWGIDRVLHRFYERAETNKAAKRKKEERTRRRAVTGQSQPAAQSVTGTIYDNDPRSIRVETADPLRGRQEAPGIQPPTEDLTTLTASQIPASEAIEIWKIHQHETIERKQAPLPMPVGQDIQHCKTFLAMAGRHAQLAKRVMEAYVRCDSNDFWKEKKWPLWAIARQRDFDEALAMARANGYSPK